MKTVSIEVRNCLEVEMTLDLTDSEWMSLIDGETEGTSLGKCCANISALRDSLIAIARDGRSEEINSWRLDDLKRCLKWASDGHTMSPLLVRVCQMIEFDPASVDHEAGPSGN